MAHKSFNVFLVDKLLLLTVKIEYESAIQQIVFTHFDLGRHSTRIESVVNLAIFVGEAIE